MLLLAAALAVAGVVVVALPFLREPAPASDALEELDAAERARLDAEEERDRALAALKELESDHRAGRITDEDYRAVVGDAAAGRGRGAPRARPAPCDAAEGPDARPRKRMMVRRAGLGRRRGPPGSPCAPRRGHRRGRPGHREGRVDNRIATLRGKAGDAQRQAGVLTDQLSAVAAACASRQAGVDAQQARLRVLEAQLGFGARGSGRSKDDRRPDRAARAAPRRSTRSRSTRLEQRVRELYMTDGPDTLAFVLGTASFADLLDNLDLLGRIGRQDERIAERVKSARDGAASPAPDPRGPRRGGARRAPSRRRRPSSAAIVTRLVASRDALVAARKEKSTTLASIQSERDRRSPRSRRSSSSLRRSRRRIRGAQRSSARRSSHRRASGVLGWPVAGPVTSGFGMRWGRMHEGIDIAVGVGTPVRAAAAGTVIYAGWMGGYGNLVVIDHGNGLSTAYAHNSSLAASVGQSVAPGECSYSGNTGHSTGPHVHFEVRVDGSAVDPLGYL